MYFSVSQKFGLGVLVVDDDKLTRETLALALSERFRVQTARNGLEALACLPAPAFPGGRWLRRPLTIAGLTWYALRDRL